MTGFVSKWVVLHGHDVREEEVDADGDVRADVVAGGADVAGRAHLEACHALAATADTTGLAMSALVGSLPPGAHFGRPQAVAVSASAREVRRSTFTIGVRLRTGAEDDVAVNASCVVCLEEEDTGAVRDLGTDVRDELIALEHAAGHFN